MAVVAELLLIRHGQSTSNVAFPRADAAVLLESGLTGRDADVELTELGARQAEAIGHWLGTLPSDRLPQVVITSPYLRAKETWRIAVEASEMDLPCRPPTNGSLTG
jgi:broad specificity phosphatase PhoE